MSTKRVFRSRSGEVACGEHAPRPDSYRWRDEGWQEIPTASDGKRRTGHQCRYCEQGAIVPAKGSEIPASPMILNVDDRPAQLYARERVLRLHGFTVANANTIKTAVATARRMKPDAILLDVHLPDGDGRELCRQMKADIDLSHVPIVLISATLSGHVSQLETVRWGHADAFLHEPVAPETMVSTMWKVIHATRASNTSDKTPARRPRR